jgi:RNA polymerase sigma-70 factor (ECF subfamily)
MSDITLETLWNQMHIRLRRFIGSRISDIDDAEDILQEVFLRIHSNLETVRDMDKVESWIYQIARNSIIDYYRGRRVLVELPDIPTKEDFPEKGAAESIAPYIQEIVQALPEPYREALILTEYQGLSQKEMADRLGISLSGAKSRVQRARQKVRDIMLACCHYEFDVRGTVCCYRERCCGCLGEQVPL